MVQTTVRWLIALDAELENLKRFVPIIMLRSILIIIFCFNMGLWLIVHAIQAIRTGIANASGQLYTRELRPISFWCTILAQCLFGILFFIVIWIS